jgi:DNA polymerase-3 subunit beta
MKLEIEKKDLLKMVSLAQTVAEKKANMSNLVNLLFVAEDNKLKVFATDLEISITSEASAKIIESGTLAVHAKNLFEIAKELSDGLVSLMSVENNRLQIKQKRFSSKIMGSTVDTYPSFPVLNTYDFNKIPKDLLLEMINKTIYSVSNDDTRYHLNGVYFERYLVEGKVKYKMVATDGHRLSLVDKPVDNGDQAQLQKNLGVIIPRKGINEINRLLESVDNYVEIAFEGSQIIIKGGNSVLLIRLIEGKYPNYQMLIPKIINHKILVQRESLLGSIKRVGLLANQKSRCVVVQISTGKMEISTVNPEMGDAHEEIEIQYEGETLKFTMNHKYIFEII